MSLPWHKREKRNYICTREIVTDIVSEGLRKIFKQEWNQRYQAKYGAWDDSPMSGNVFLHLEKSRPRANKGHLIKFQHGNTKNWDCSVLFDAILYSNAIGKAGFNAAVRSEVDSLRQIRNPVFHASEGQLTVAEFQSAFQTVRKAFLALGLPIAELDEIKTNLINFNSFQVLPPHPCHDVTSRAEVSTILNDLQKLYSDNDGKLTYFYISGNPGSGKSQLARQVGERFYNEQIAKPETGLTFVMTLNGRSLDTLLQSYREFAVHLGCDKHDVANITDSSQPLDVKIRQLRTTITTRVKSYSSWLIIVDNIERLNVLTALLPQIKDDNWKGGQVLVTTQDGSYIPPDSSLNLHLSVSRGMEETECCNLLAKLSGTGSDPILGEVAKQLDYQPLALAAAGVYVNKVVQSKATRGFSWRNYLEKLDQGKKQLTEKQLHKINYPAYSETMSSAVLLAVEEAGNNDVVLKHTFHFLSSISHESLPLDIAVDYVLFLNEDLDRDEIGIKIQECSLFLSEDEECVTIRQHRVVHDAIKVYAEKGEVKEISRKFDAAAKSFYQFESRNYCRILVPHLKAFHASIRNKFPNHETLYPLNKNARYDEMFSYFGSVLQRFGKFTISKDFYNAALKFSIRQLGPEDVDIATFYNNLGLIYSDLGDLQQAKKYHELSLCLQIKHLGQDHVDVASSYNNLGLLYSDLGDLQQAKRYHELALDIQIRQLGPDHVDIAASYNNLGSLYSDLGDLQEAKRYHELSLDIKIQKLGADHVDVATSYNNLGCVYRDLGDLQQAEKYYQLSLDIKIKQLGSDHVAVATSYNNLATVYSDLGDLEEAKKYHKSSLDIKIKQLGSDHVGLATSYNNLGSVYSDLGDLEQAKKYHELSLDIRIKQFGPDHVDVATSYNNLGSLYCDSGDLQQAKKYHELSLEIRIKQLGAEHVDVATSYNNLGLVYYYIGDLPQAKRYCVLARDLLTKHLGSNHAKVATCRKNVDYILCTLNEP